MADQPRTDLKHRLLIRIVSLGGVGGRLWGMNIRERDIGGWHFGAYLQGAMKSKSR